MFQLTEKEFNSLRFQSETTKQISMMRTLLYVFTEQGGAMLATILRSSVVEEVSIRIMDTFVKISHFIMENKDIYQSFNYVNKIDDKKVIKKLFEIIENIIKTSFILQ